MNKEISENIYDISDEDFDKAGELYNKLHECIDNNPSKIVLISLGYLVGEFIHYHINKIGVFDKKSLQDNILMISDKYIDLMTTDKYIHNFDNINSPEK